MAFIGSPLAALLTGCILSLVLTGKEWKTKKVLSNWVDEGINAAAMPIIVTGMGGALAVFVKNSGVADQIGQIIVASPFPPIIVPVILAAIIHVVTGSNALGVMTAAALVQPMLECSSTRTPADSGSRSRCPTWTSTRVSAPSAAARP